MVGRMSALPHIPAGKLGILMGAYRVNKHIRPGQRVRFLFTYDEPGVWAWDMSHETEPYVDIARYTELLIRAAATILQPLGWEETAVRCRRLGHAQQVEIPFPAPTNVSPKEIQAMCMKH